MKRLEATWMRSSMVCLVWLLVAGRSASADGPADDASLPDGVRAVWDLKQAHREATPTRERISINGLWRWQPAEKADGVPAGSWGYFKVPGCWPGVSDYMQHDCQTVYAHPSWKDAKLGEPFRGLVPARDQRAEGVGGPPRHALPGVPQFQRRRLHRRQESRRSPVSGRRGRSHIRLPAGEQAPAQPAGRRPAAAGNHAHVQRHERGPGRRRQGRAARVVRRRLPRRRTGGSAASATSRSTLRSARARSRSSAALENLTPHARYALRAAITDHGRKVREFTSRTFEAGDLQDGRFELTEKWMPEKLWDLHTPQNVYEAAVSLEEGGTGPWTPPCRCGSASASCGSTAATSTSTARGSSSRRCRWTTPR